jgi:Protein of unknown function (DUF3015)
MHKIRQTFLALALVVPTGVAFADSGAGCGLGQQIFAGQTGLFAHVVAATTNGSTTNQWLGISFNSLGCDETNVVTNEYQRKAFMTANLDNLSQDIAQGQGEHLAALAALMGIPQDERSAFFALTQHNAPALVATSNSADAMYTALADTLRADVRFAGYAN